MSRPDYDPNPISLNPYPLTPGRVGSGLAGRDPSATPRMRLQTEDVFGMEGSSGMARNSGGYGMDSESCGFLEGSTC